MDGTPSWSEYLIEIVRSKTICAIITHLEQSSKQGIRKGGCQCECCDSVVERWRLKLEAMGSTPSGTTFLSFSLPLQSSSDSNGTDCNEIH